MFFKRFLFARFVLILALFSATVGIGSPKPVSAAPGDTALISLGKIPSPLGANNSSYRPSISADGRYVAFYSSATNLVSNDTNSKVDIFVFDRQTGVVERVSVDSNGAQANGDSGFPSISVDGRYVAFVSDASNLVSNDTNGGKDIFIHDRQTALTERISTVSPYTPGADSGYIPPSISGDGRYVAFGSAASALVSGDTNGVEDIFVYDRQMGLTVRVSVGLGGAESNNHSYAPALSVDGRYVTYDSSADNLVSDDTNGVGDTFVYDRQTGITERVSVDSSGAEANSYSSWPSISSDGRYVAFGSDATNLVSGDMNSQSDVFVRDRQTGITERVSVSSSGAQGNWNSYAPSISADGRYVAFASYAGTLVSGDTNNAWDIFLYDRQAETTQRVSVDSSGVQGDSHSDWPSLSADGRFVAFTSDAENLVSTDLNYNNDIFVHDRQTSVTEIASVGPVGMGANQGSYDPSISSDGRYVSFVSAASNFVSDDTNRKSDVFVYDRQSGTVERVSVDSSGSQVNDVSNAPVLSADGRYVAFVSLASNLVIGDTNNTWDIFVHDRQTGVTERVSINSSDAQANGGSEYPSVSADGRYVVFESYASNLVSGGNSVRNIYLRDRQTGVTERISTTPGGILPNNGSESASISADGRYVAFRSRASNLVTGDTNNTEDIFVYDRQLGVTERVSVDSGGAQTNNASQSPSISGDGRYATFSSDASNLVSGDTNGMRDIFVHDRQTGLTERVSVDSSGTEANSNSDSSCISSDGRYVSFASNASNLVGSDTNNLTDIFIHDRETGITERVSVDSSDVQANGNSTSPSITADGQFVAFTSGASNLVSDDNNYAYDIFLHENDILPKVLGIVRAGSDPTNAASVNFTVTFSKPVKDVDAGDFTLDTTSGIVNAVVSEVTGTGSTRTVVVNTGSGNGTLLLVVPVDATIRDLAGNSLGKLPFVTGEAYTIKKPASVKISIHGNLQGTYSILPGGSIRKSFASINNGPVKVFSTNYIPLIAAERVIYDVNGMPTSFSEMMGLPDKQLDTTYWLPWYNSKSLNTQIRIANVSDTEAAVNVSIGGTPVPSGPFTIPAGGSRRLSFPDIDKGPVKIKSNVKIVAAERVIYRVNDVDTSFSETMALPNSQLSTTYWLPWYNNKDLDTQLRVANASDQLATVQIRIGGENMIGSPFTLAAGASRRLSFPGINKGPVEIESNVNIIAAERVIYKAAGGTPTSFSEMMALPDTQLDTTYWLPWYNNVELDTQLRLANVSDSPATVHVTIGGVEVMGSPFTLASGVGLRKSFVGINKGPVKIESNVNIVAAERVIYKVAGGTPTSFSEMMGLPASQLDMIYWLPWYNNKELDTQLRFGVP